MLKTSLIFIGIALAALGVADLTVISLHPWGELGRMLQGMVVPDLLMLKEIWRSLLNTLAFALCGILLGLGMGAPLSFCFHLTPVRLFCAFIRAIHEIFWAFIFLPIIGLTPLCGVLAIGLPYAGIFAKVFAEIRQESDQRPLQGIPGGAFALSRFCYGSLPVIYRDLKHYTAYRFECALRSSAVLGFIGLPTLGYHLETAFREAQYAQAAAILYAFYLLIASIKIWARPRTILIPVILALLFLSKEIYFSWDNVVRFFSYDILPWPMRRQGVLDGSRAVAYPLREVGLWALSLFEQEGLRGVWNTVVLTQIALALTGLLTVAGFPLACVHFMGKIGRRLSHWVLIVVRTTPEYILAYVLLQLWGPSMLPAVVAIALHNGAILAYLTSQNADLIQLPIDAPRKPTHRYLFEILPRVYGQFLAFLFYRWEVMMRESAILGILGIYTLGFFIDSAIADQHLDDAVLLIFMTALLNMGIDTVSQVVRRRLKISTKLVTST
jgi:phosphonate transport system permease protein